MRTMRRLLIFLRPYIGMVSLSVLTGTATIACGIGLMGTSAYLLAAAALHPSVAVLQVAIVGVRFFGLSRGIMRYLERLASHSVNLQVLGSLRSWFFRILEPLAPARLMYTGSGDLLTRGVADIETLENFYVRVISPSLTLLFITAGMGIFLGSFIPVLGWAIVGGLILTGFIAPGFIFVAAKIPGKGMVASRAAMGSAIVEFSQGLPELLVYGQATEYIQRIEWQGSQAGRAQSAITWLTGLGNGLIVLINGGIVWLLLRLAIPLVGGGRIDGIGISVVALSAMAAFEAAQAMIPAAGMLEACLQAANRLFELADARAEISEPDQPKTLVSGGTLETTGLTFSYKQGEEAALQNFDLTLRPGQRVAVIGESGAGKSTLIHLLMRFWGGFAGSLRIGNIEFDEVNSQEIRRQMAWVSGSGWIFRGSIAENLRIATKEAGSDKLWAALVAAELADMVRSLPQGLDTQIGERGLTLSGGERQRLLIARAILQDAPIWLLDEPTDGLDTVTEAAVLETLFKVTGGRQSLWVVHRLVKLERMDEIIVLGRGQVIERGTYQELLEGNSKLRQLIEVQTSLLEET